MPDIFLSYTAKDRDAARRVAAMLESFGWTVWWDRRIPAGETWRSVLDHALENTRCMIVLWSANSIESEWVSEEASEGRRQGKLVPVLIEPVRPPAGFREIQAADLSQWDGSLECEGVRMLIGDLENLLGKPDPTTTRPTAPRDTTDRGRPYDPADLHTEATPARRWALRRLPAWAIAGALVLGGAAILVPVTMRDSSFEAPEATETTPQPSETAMPDPSPTPPTLEIAPTPPALESTATVQPEPESPLEPTKAEPPVVRPTTVARPPTIAKHPEPTPAMSSRCVDLLTRIQLGEPLSGEAQATFLEECTR